MRWNLSDRLQLNRLTLSASYSPGTDLPAAERVHLRAHYQRYDWRAEALLNNADFFGNNYVDRGDEKRYRKYDSLAGAEVNEIGGRNFVRSVVEWNLPPWRFARLGTPGPYATWLRPALFVTGLATNLDDSAVRRTVASIGAQADVRISAMSALDLTLSFGGAVAFEDGYKARREFMVSVKVLR